MWKLCSDQVIRRCIPDHETDSVLEFYHSSAPGGHLGVQRTARKILTVAFIGPPSLKMRGRFVAPVSSVREQEVHLHGDNTCLSNLCYSFVYVYILLAVDYVSKWVEAKPTRSNDAKAVVDFVRSNLF